MSTYDPVKVWASEVERSGRRFKQVVGKWNAQGRKSGNTGNVGKFAVTAAAIELHTNAVRAWHEAQNILGRL